MENHIHDDALDRYALGQTAEDEPAAIEEHLLICEECQERLKLTDAFVTALRSAAKKANAAGAG